METNETYTISALSNEFGVSLRTLRFYEQRGIVIPRRSGLTRIYSSRDRIRIQLVLIGKRLGLTIEEIAGLISKQSAEITLEDANANHLLSGLSRDEIATQISRLEDKLASIDNAIAELRSVHRRERVSG